MQFSEYFDIHVDDGDWFDPILGTDARPFVDR